MSIDKRISLKFALTLCCGILFSSQALAKTYYATQSTDKTWCLYAQALSRDKLLGNEGIYLWADIDYGQGKITTMTVTRSGSAFESFKKDSYQIHGADDYDVSRQVLIPQDQYKRSYLFKFRANKLIYQTKGGDSWESEPPYKLAYFPMGDLIKAFETHGSGQICMKAA